LQPLLDFLGVLLVRLLDRLLRGVAPAVKVLADRADRHVLLCLLLDQIPDGGAGPQRTGDAQILRRLGVGWVVDGCFVLKVEAAARADRAAGAITWEGLVAALLVADTPARHRLLADAQDVCDFHHRIAFLAGGAAGNSSGEKACLE